MAGFWGSLGNVAAKGAVAYGQQQEDNTRALILEKARQAQAQRQRQMDAIATDDRAHRLEQDRIGNVIKGYTPPSTTVALRPDLRPTAAPPAFGEALERGLSNATTPLGGETPAGTLTAPLRHGDLGSIPDVEVTNTPESFTDPDIAKHAAEKAADAEGAATARMAKVQRLVGLKMADGTVVTPAMAEAMVDNPAMAGMYTKTPPPPRAEARDHYTFITTTGPDGQQVISRANTNTGQIEATGAQAKAGGAGKAPSEGQTAAGMFAARMESAETLLAKHEKAGTTTTGLSAAGGVPLVGHALRNMISNPEQQMYRQAQEDWVRAKLRKESGAAIGKSEMEDEIATYFKQPGDGPEVVAQKAERRREATRLLRQASGGAGKLFGPPPSSGAGDARQSAPLRPDLRGGQTVTVNGRTYRLPE